MTVIPNIKELGEEESENTNCYSCKIDIVICNLQETKAQRNLSRVTQWFN